MQKYGIIQDGNFLLSSKPLEGYKEVIYAEIPEFDQSTHYVSQTAPVDQGDTIFVGVEILELEIDENENLEEVNF